MRTRSVILGGGPAGLGAARTLLDLNQSVSLVEPNPEGVGLCSSFKLAGHILDLGGHAFFTHLPEAESALVCQDHEIYAQERDARIYHQRRFVPYPFQSHLHGLDHEYIERIIREICAREESSLQQADSLDAWLVGAFGPTMAESFLIPYNQKVQAWELSEIVPTWVRSRVVLPPVADILVGALRPRTSRDYPNAVVRYPAGGFAQMFSHLKRRVEASVVRAQCTGVDLLKKTVRLDNGSTIKYDRLVSTIPLDALVSMLLPENEFLVNLGSSLKFNSERLYTYVFPKAPTGEIVGCQRAYSADPSHPFHKLVFNDLSHPQLERQTFSVQAEVTYSERFPLAADSEAQVLNGIRSIWPNCGIPVARDVRDIRRAYGSR